MAPPRGRPASPVSPPRRRTQHVPQDALVTRADLIGALRVLRERGWLIGLISVVVLSVAFVRLGEWQHHRYESKVERNRWIDANYDAPAAPLAGLLPAGATSLPRAQEWRSAEVQGVYESFAQVLIRNRPLHGDAGFEVVVPLRRDDGSALLVDRGWLPLGTTGGSPDVVPAPPGGRVDLVVRLRPGEPPSDRTPPPGQQFRIDPQRIAQDVIGPVLPLYGVLASETPATTPAPTLLPRPDEDLGPHLGYAWQWWMFASAAYLIFGYYLLREQRQRSGNPEPIRLRMPASLAARRSRVREPSDEEWEDAADR